MPRLPVHPTAEMDPEDMVSISAESSNETASDIPGPGRLLGKFYARLGWMPETVLNLIARSMGRGPVTTSNEIQRLALTLKYPERYLDSRAPSETRVVVKKLEKKLEKGCRILVRYIWYVQCTFCIGF